MSDLNGQVMAPLQTAQQVVLITQQRWSLMRNASWLVEQA